jgi:hypothetical protein
MKISELLGVLQCPAIVVGMTQRCYIAIWKSAERLDRPTKKSEFALELVLFSVRS